MIINYSNGFTLTCEFGGKPGQRRDVGNGVGYYGVLGERREEICMEETPDTTLTPVYGITREVENVIKKKNKSNFDVNCFLQIVRFYGLLRFRW